MTGRQSPPKSCTLSNRNTPTYMNTCLFEKMIHVQPPRRRSDKKCEIRGYNMSLHTVHSPFPLF